MQLDDFDFDLPERLIALRPVQPRRAARLLVASDGMIKDSYVQDCAAEFTAGDLLVINNTKVIPARLSGERTRDEQTARIEVTLLSPDAQGNWGALIKPLRKVKDGELIRFSDTLNATLIRRDAGQATLMFNLQGAGFEAALNRLGTMPLPPYIASKRPADDRDRVDYQTAFAKTQGAVAAPTASLHFDEVVLGALKDKGVEFAEVTLHVGAGTFLPVKVEDVTTHKMHAEWGQVTQEAADQINAAKARGNRVIPVGTTALRLIETAAQAAGLTPAHIAPWQGETDIFIYPGFQFQITDALMTNFHLPKSTLLMLVSALMGQERMREIYAHAIAQDYRFFSYGDSSLLIPG